MRCYIAAARTVQENRIDAGLRLRQAVRQEQRSVRVRAAAPRYQEQHVISGLKRRLQAVKLFGRSDRMMVNAEDDIAMMNAEVQGESAWLDVHNQDTLLTVQMEFVHQVQRLLMS